jgi:hypothetical protein
MAQAVKSKEVPYGVIAVIHHAQIRSGYWIVSTILCKADGGLAGIVVFPRPIRAEIK